MPTPTPTALSGPVSPLEGLFALGDIVDTRLLLLAASFVFLSLVLTISYSLVFDGRTPPLLSTINLSSFILILPLLYLAFTQDRFRGQASVLLLLFVPIFIITLCQLAVVYLLRRTMDRAVRRILYRYETTWRLPSRQAAEDAVTVEVAASEIHPAEDVLAEGDDVELFREVLYNLLELDIFPTPYLFGKGKYENRERVRRLLLAFVEPKIVVNNEDFLGNRGERGLLAMLYGTLAILSFVAFVAAAAVVLQIT